MSMTKTGDKVNPMYLARLWARDAGNHPVVVIKGDQPPKKCGEEWHYRNRSGDVIYHPSAYSRRGFSSMVYHNSTIEVTVGRNWLHRHRGARYHRSDDGTLSVILPQRYWHRVHGFSCRPGYSDGRKIWIVEGRGHQYHVGRHKRTLDDARRAVTIVIGEIRKRHAADLSRIDLENTGAWVGFADSLAAGNCAIGTESWARRHGLAVNLHWPIPVILAEARKNGSYAYAERACKAAAARHQEEMRQGYCELAR